MRTTSGTPDVVDACAVLDTAASALADAGPEGVAPVLDGVAHALDVRSVVLRDAHSGDVRAVGGAVVHAVPQHGAAVGPEPVVELPVHSRGIQVATLTVVGARASHLPLLRALCGVLGLALVPRPVSAADPLPLALLAAADSDADDTADDLHDGPVQELVLARFAADAAVRGGDAAFAREAVQSALQSMRRALWLLRPRGAGDGGLSAALDQLSERLVEGGRPPLTVAVDADAGTALIPPAASVAYRLVQTVVRTSAAPVRVRVSRSDRSVLVEVTGSAPLPAPDRWSARARALGATLTTDPAGRVALSVPVSPRTDPHDEFEAIP